jgi:hypothetical protein
MKDNSRSNSRSTTFSNTVEKVQHPHHYGGDTPYEVIKVLRNWFSEEQFEGFLVGNAIKYLARYKKKNGIEDVQKAEFYVKYLEKFLLECKNQEGKNEG